MRSTGTGNWRAPHGRNAAGFVVAEVASLVNASVVGLEKISVNLFFFFLAKILAKRRRTNFQSVFIWELFFFSYHFGGRRDWVATDKADVHRVEAMVYERRAEGAEVKVHVDRLLEALVMVYEHKVPEEEDLVVGRKEDGKVGHRAEAGDAGTSVKEEVVDNILQKGEEVLEEDPGLDTTSQENEMNQV